MALSILNNIPALAAQNQLSITGASLQKTLFRLSTGSRINSGADDAAGLAIADGLHANKIPGRVVRHLEEGFAIEFTRLQHPDSVEDNATAQ